MINNMAETGHAMHIHHMLYGICQATRSLAFRHLKPLFWRPCSAFLVQPFAKFTICEGNPSAPNSAERNLFGPFHAPFCLLPNNADINVQKLDHSQMLSEHMNCAHRIVKPSLSIEYGKAPTDRIVTASGTIH